MIRWAILGTMLLSAAVSEGAINASLSGTITKAEGGGALAGARITTTLFAVTRFDTITERSHAKQVITDSLGKFSIILNNAMSTLQPKTSSAAPLPFILKDNAILFSPAFGALSGRMDIYSSDGKNSFSQSFHDLKAGKHRISLPRLSGGINIMKLVINGDLFTQKLLCMGNTVYSQSGFGYSQKAEPATMAKCMAITDTLVVYKKEYIDGRLPLDSYVKPNIAISMSLGVLRSMFQISNTMIPNWKMTNPSLDRSFTIWSASDLYNDIDGGYEVYTDRGMLQAADILMTGPQDPDTNGGAQNHMVLSPTFIMDFGTEASAKNMYTYFKNKYYSSDAGTTIPGYDTSIAWGDAGFGSLTVYSYYKKFFFQLDLEHYSNPDTAIANGKMFLDFFKSKIQ